MAAPIHPDEVRFRDGKRVLLRILKEPLSGHGFKHLKSLSFGRDHCGALELLSFGAYHGEGGTFCTSFGVGVRFPILEALLDPDPAEDLMPTVGAPLSVLKDSPGFPRWCFDGRVSQAHIASQILVDVEKYGLPFLERYSSMANVRESLEKDDPQQWLGLPPEQRLATLVAIEHVEGRTADALRRLDRGLQALQGAPPSKRFALEELRKRLITGDSVR